MKTREWNHVHCELTKIAVKLSRETEGASGSGDGTGNEVVKIIVGRVLQLQSTEANIVKSLVIKSETLVSVFYQLMDGKGSVIRLNNGVRNLRRRNDRVCAHDTIGVLLTDLGNKKSSHTGSSSSSHGMSYLESLKHVTSLSLLTYNIHDVIYKLGTLGVMSLSPVISCSTLSVYEVIGAEKLSVRRSADGIHGSWLKIGKNGTWNVTSSLSLVEVNIDALKLDGVISSVGSVEKKAVLGGHGLPELVTDLVTALSCLNVYDFSHVELV